MSHSECCSETDRHQASNITVVLDPRRGHWVDFENVTIRWEPTGDGCEPLRGSMLNVQLDQGQR